MFKIKKIMLLSSICLLFFSQNVKAEAVVEINQLIEHAKDYDQKQVTIQGEVIGECMERGDYIWINIIDKSNAIGIWLPISEKEKITYYGNYKAIGDTIEVTGTFYQACKEHGGESDFHSESLTVVKAGHLVDEEISNYRIIIAVIATLFVFLLFPFFIKYIRNRK